MPGGGSYCEPGGIPRRPEMKTAVLRAAGRLADAIREAHEAQQLMLVKRTAMDRYVKNPDAAPDTYSEFLFRTSGTLVHEPPARKRMRRAGRIPIH
jgi:hypothetical protein